MDLAIVTSSLLVILEVAEGLKCDHATGLKITELRTDFRLNRSDNFFDSKLRAVFQYEVADDTSALDGFAYKFSARPRDEELGKNLFFNKRRNHANATACVGVEGSVWLRGEDSPCQLPCTGKISRGCGDLCSILDAGYKTVPADARELEFQVQFGEVYDLHVVPYRDWSLGFGALATGNEVIKYCKGGGSDSRDCTNTTELKITDRQIYSGPVSHFEKYDVTIDHTQNRAKVSFRWKRPYDYHPNATLEKYLIVKDETYPLPQELGGADHDAITIENVTIGSIHTLRVVPVLHYHESSDYVIIVHGANFLEQYSVEDFDACKVDNGFGGRYCDEVANCSDLPRTANTSAICVCQFGLYGNGISTKWPEGNGCKANGVSSSETAIAVGISCTLLALLIVVLATVCVRSRNPKIRSKILREEEL